MQKNNDSLISLDTVIMALPDVYVKKITIHAELKWSNDLSFQLKHIHHNVMKQ